MLRKIHKYGLKKKIAQDPDEIVWSSRQVIVIKPSSQTVWQLPKQLIAVTYLVTMRLLRAKLCLEDQVIDRSIPVLGEFPV